MALLHGFYQSSDSEGSLGAKNLSMVVPFEELAIIASRVLSSKSISPKIVIKLGLLFGLNPSHLSKYSHSCE